MEELIIAGKTFRHARKLCDILSLLLDSSGIEYMVTKCADKFEICLNDKKIKRIIFVPQNSSLMKSQENSII